LRKSHFKRSNANHSATDQRIDTLNSVAYIGNMQRSKSNKLTSLGDYLRQRRETLAAKDSSFSLRQLAVRCGVTPAYLSRVERDEVPPPGEETLLKLAAELLEDPDVLLAMAGKISADLRQVILSRPKLFADLIRSIKSMPDQAVLKIVRDVRDGEW
jgi:transcriptional regulator with XRE-family HTH domain